MPVLFTVAIVLLVLAVLGLLHVLAMGLNIVLFLLIAAIAFAIVAFSQGRFW